MKTVKTFKAFSDVFMSNKEVCCVDAQLLNKEAVEYDFSEAFAKYNFLASFITTQTMLGYRPVGFFGVGEQTFLVLEDLVAAYFIVVNADKPLETADKLVELIANKISQQTAPIQVPGSNDFN